MSEIKQKIRKIYHANLPDAEDLVSLLSCCDKDETEMIFSFADKVRKKFMGDGILLRGIIEFSNFCRNDCFYCGLSRENKHLIRYRLTKEQIMNSVSDLVSYGIKTVVLQSGEDEDLDPLWMKEIVEEIKLRFQIAVTLSIGERTKEEYQMWKDAGADRYLLKIETSDKNLYESAHRNRNFGNRIRCLQELKKLGYQTGSGNLIGIKKQTLHSIARDILFFKLENFDMIGIGPFIPHPDTVFSHEPCTDVMLTLKTLALTRIVTKNAHLPSTTALGSMKKDYRFEGLKAGANVLMFNFTPQPYRKLYEIYPGKKCVDEPLNSCVSWTRHLSDMSGRKVDYSVGHSLKN